MADATAIGAGGDSPIKLIHSATGERRLTEIMLALHARLSSRATRAHAILRTVEDEVQNSGLDLDASVLRASDVADLIDAVERRLSPGF